MGLPSPAEDWAAEALLVGQAGAPGASAIEASLAMATFYVGSSVLYLAAALFGAFTRLR